MAGQETTSQPGAPVTNTPGDEAGRRLQLLADAGMLLSASLDWKATIAGVARLALGAFADWTVVDVLDEAGRVHRLGVQHSDPTKATLAAEYATFPPDPARPSSVWLALRTGRTQLVAQVEGAALDAAARAQRPHALAQALGHASFIVAPLIARERILGALTFARGEGAARYGEEDRAFAEEIARRAALAMDNARLLRDARRAEEESRRAAERLRVLAEASQLFAEAHLDLSRVLEAIARFAARALSGCAVVLMPDGAAGGRLLPAAVASERRPDPLGLSVEEVREAQARALASLDGPGERLSVEELASRLRPEECFFTRSVGARQLLVAPLAHQGATFGALAVARDTTEEPFDPDDRALLEDLAHRAAFAIENARLYRRATEAVSVRDGFLSVAGHELKTPLTALQLQVRCLERDVRESGHRERVLKLERQARRLGSLVDQLLDVSRISAGRLRLEREPLDLSGLVRERVAVLGEDLGHAACDVRLAAPEPVLGRWDRLRMEQVVTNLLTNALKYGCGKPIDITVLGSHAAGRLEVRDRGIGIAPEDQARIFDRFERAVSARHFGGLGLGLWIARQIVEAHGGTIGVESTAGEGAAFTVELPRQPAPAS